MAYETNYYNPKDKNWYTTPQWEGQKQGILYSAWGAGSTSTATATNPQAPSETPNEWNNYYNPTYESWWWDPQWEGQAGGRKYDYNWQGSSRYYNPSTSTWYKDPLWEGQKPGTWYDAADVPTPTPVPDLGGGDDEETPGQYVDPRTGEWSTTKLWVGQQPGIGYSAIPEGSLWAGVGINGWQGGYYDEALRQQQEFEDAQAATTAQYDADLQTWLDQQSQDWATNSQNLAQEYRDNYQPYLDQLGQTLDRIPQFEAPDYSGIDSLLSRLESGPDETDVTQARGLTAENLGYDDWASFVNELTTMRNSTRADMPGLTDAERSQYEKSSRMNIASTEKRAQDQLEKVFANTGSYTRYLAAADEANQQISDQRLQYDMAMMNQEMALQATALERQDKIYADLIARGQAGVEQVLQRRDNGIMAALNGYLEKAGLKLQEYATEVQGITAQADAIYKMAMTQMGIDQGILDTMESEYNMRMKPIIDNLSILMQQRASQVAEANVAMQGFSALLGAIIPG